MDIEIYDRYILCIYECGGLTAAAKQLGITQPALSMSLGNLEKRLGFAIFNRKTKPISLTEEGQIYIDYLKRQNLLRQDCQKAIEDLHSKKNRTLTVGGSVIYVDAILIDAVKQMRKREKDCEITVIADQLTTLIEETAEGRMDCFISTSEDLPGQFAKVRLHKEKLYLCIPKSWPINEELRDFQIQPEQKGSCMDFSKIDGLEIISLLDSLPLQAEVDRFIRENGLQLKRAVTVNQVSAGVRLAAEGVGMMVATGDALTGARFKDSLCIYQLPEDVAGRDIYVAYDSKRYQSGLCMDFIRQLQKAAEV